MTDLRRVLLELVAAASLTGGVAGCFDTDDPKPRDAKDGTCNSFVEVRERIVEPTTDDYARLLRACESDAKRCMELCDAVIRHQEGSPQNVAHACAVHHDGTAHDVIAGYYAVADENCYEAVIVDGRRPHGLRCAKRRPRATLVGSHLARAAWFEGASVHAFVALARELARHGAPDELVSASRRAAVEEVRHARLVTALARAHGAEPPRVEVAAPRRRSIESIAIENAREGLVGETWAALVATWQAQHAPAGVRETYAQIAPDEAGHAELSRAIDRWARTRLSRAAIRRVDAVRDAAVAQLERGVGGFRRPLVRGLGLPSTRPARQLFASAKHVLRHA